VSLTNGVFTRWILAYVWNRGGANADFVTAALVDRLHTHDFADLQTEIQMMESRMCSRTDRPRSITEAFVYMRMFVHVRCIAL